MATFNRINRLRFFQILRPHIGEEASSEFGEALEDEFSPLATKEDVTMLLETLRADMKHDQQSMLLKATAIWTALLAAAVAIAQLF